MSSREEKLSIEKLLSEQDIDPKKLHQQAARLTRKKLLLTAMECFAQKGYQKTTIREIAAKAGVTLGAVYHHFTGKKELLMAVNRSRQIHSSEILGKAMGEHEDFFEALRVALRGQFKLLAEDPILRGVTREYMAMAMTDADINEMHCRADMDFRDMAEAELKRRYPKLSASRRASLIRMLFVSFEGLMTALVVGSPVPGQAEEVLDSLMETFQYSIEERDSKSARN